MFSRHFDKDAIIFEEGALGLEFYIILTGSVAIRKRLNGVDQLLAILKAGHFFGEMAILDGFPRSATAVAVEHDTTLMAVDAARFIYLVSQQPAFAMLIMEALSKRQRIREQPLCAESAKPAPFTSRTSDVIPLDSSTFQLRSHSRSCNAYLFCGPKANVLIDTALPSGLPSLVSAISLTGLSPTAIDLIILTHEHFDHTAAVPSLSNSAAVASHPLAANKIHLHDEFATLEHAFGEPHAAFNVDVCLNHDSVIDTGNHRLRIVFTPGHSSGGLSIFDETSGVLVSGDTVFKNGTIGGVFGSGNISDLIYSLNLLRALGSKQLLPGHGPISSASADDIDQTLGRCKLLLDDSRRMFDAMQGNESVNLIIDAYKDLNRKYMR